MQRFLGGLLSLVVSSTTLFAANPADAEVKSVIQRFHDALERHDVGAIATLVSSDVVVLENGATTGGRTSVTITWCRNSRSQQRRPNGSL